MTNDCNRICRKKELKFARLFSHLKATESVQMTKPQFLRTRYEWLDALTPGVAATDIPSLKQILDDEVYKALNQKYARNVEAFNFSNSKSHNARIVQTLNEIRKSHGASEDLIRKYLTDLSSRNTYGTFCELSAYYFLLKGAHSFDVQAHLSGTEILNPNGSDLDGVLRLPDEIFFDTKAFGFHEHLINILVRKLSHDLAPDVVQAEDSWDVSVRLLFGLLGPNYEALKTEIVQNNSAKRERIRFVKRNQAPVMFSARSVSPEELAITNKEYALNYAKQFVLNKPFILIFVTHPWLSGLSFHNNFDRGVDRFTERFAELTFKSFLQDSSPVLGVARGDASRLISGLLFIDAWADQPQHPDPKHRLLVNSNAKNPLSPDVIRAFGAPYGRSLRTVNV